MLIYACLDHVDSCLTYTYLSSDLIYIAQIILPQTHRLSNTLQFRTVQDIHINLQCITCRNVSSLFIIQALASGHF